MSNVTDTPITSPELLLLQLIIENDFVLSEADKAVRDGAREAQREAMEDELEAIEEQADAIRTGALVEGSLQIAGGTLTVTGAVAEANANGTLEAPELTPQEQQIAATNTDLLSAVSPEQPSPWTLPTLKGGGALATGLAPAAGNLFGDAEERDAARDAKAAEQAQEQASWIAGDAEDHRQQVEQHAEAILAQVQGIVETQHQTTVAVLANI